MAPSPVQGSHHGISLLHQSLALSLIVPRGACTVLALATTACPALYGAADPVKISSGQKEACCS